MPQTINPANESQIIGGIFSSHDHADQAVAAFRELGISPDNLQVVVKLNRDEHEDSYTSSLLARGFSESHALYFNQVVRQGKVFVAVYNVTDPAAVIDVFDRCQAEYNPNGSRNLRQDVVGMTAGAMIGAATLGAVGAVIGGPVGAVAGATAGAALGGGTGAAAGTSVEHRK